MELLNTNDKLKEIGFYTLEDSRAKNVGIDAPLWRCELLLTSRCNFKCPYCRGMKSEDQGDIPLEEALRTINMWSKEGLKNIRFSGGEPTLYKDLAFLCKYSVDNGVKRVAVSTNGSADLDLYYNLIKNGVNDFSISLDSCCSTTGNMLTGGVKAWDKVINNINKLSKITYVTVGVVLTPTNISETENIIKLAIELGVSDIRLITAAQTEKKLPLIKHIDVYEKFKILKYRLSNIYSGRGVRGITENDNHKCPLVIDDMAVLNGKHYPCIIYLREQGNAIGKVGPNMRQERYNWFLNHNCYKDKICRNNCLDVCIDYNNRVKDLNSK